MLNNTKGRMFKCVTCPKEEGANTPKHTSIKNAIAILLTTVLFFTVIVGVSSVWIWLYSVLYLLAIAGQIYLWHESWENKKRQFSVTLYITEHIMTIHRGDKNLYIARAEQIAGAIGDVDNNRVYFIPNPETTDDELRLIFERGFCFRPDVYWDAIDGISRLTKTVDLNSESAVIRRNLEY